MSAIFPTLIPLGEAAGELRERRAPAEFYLDAIELLDAEIARLKAKYPQHFIQENENAAKD